jgi:tetratricopeptide (TPR) repeat protein
MTQIAKAHNISRTFLYQLIFMARLNLEVLFSDEKRLLQTEHRHLEQVILLLRLEGKCSIPSISSILQALEYQPHSVGYLSQFLQNYGRSLPSTLPLARPKSVFYLSDEIFASHAPILVTIDAQSTAILKIELASDRSAETWKAHFAALEDHQFYSLGMASDRGVGLVAGYQGAFETPLWVCDYFHEFRELFKVVQRLERKAYGAIGEQQDAARKFENAKSESNLQKRLQQYEKANQACEQAVALYDQLNTALQLLRETLQLCSPKGRLRTVQGVRSELRQLLQMIEELDCAAVTETLKPIDKHIDEILVPFKQCEAIDAQLREVVPHCALDFLYLAWHHDHFFHQSQSKQKRYHRAEREHWLALAEGLLADEFEPFKALVFDKLDSIVRASSLVEMVNSLIRPYLNSCKGHITQESLNLIMFYHNHRRYKSGKRKGKAPLELVTGKPLQRQWWELLIEQVKSDKDCKGPFALPSRPAPQPMADNNSYRDRQAVSQGQAILRHTGASEKELRQTAAEPA